MITADLNSKTALVTGASSGFGAHFSKVLAAAGAHVVGAARRVDRLSDLVDNIKSTGGSAEAVPLDVSDDKAVTSAFECLPDFDIVVNNAGVAGDTRSIDTPADEFRWTYEVNVNGAFFVAQAAARTMIAAGKGGSIINIASITSYRPAAGSAAYASSKAAVLHLTKNLALDWARHGIRVNAIAPGYFVTDINSGFLASDYGQAMKKRMPQRRWGEMQDLTGPLLLLASDASAYMTGACLEVDGGHLCSSL